MLELEVKVLNIDIDEMESKLINLGAKLICKEEQINQVIDTSDGKIQNELSGYLRIRESKSLIDGELSKEMTFKKQEKKKNIRVSEEKTVEIKDTQGLLEILRELGYEVVSKGFKVRKSYELDGIRFDMDQWDEETYPFPYMEIEVDRVGDLEKAIELLEIDRKNITTKSITELQEELND